MKAFTKEEVLKIFDIMCKNFLTSSTLVIGMHYILIGKSLMGDEKPAILPVLTPEADTEKLKKIIDGIISETGKSILYKYILCFDVSRNEVKGSIEDIGEGIISQKLVKNVQTEEEFSDLKYQVFN